MKTLKLLAGLCLVTTLAVGQNPNSAAFPSAIATDQTLGVGKDNASTTLASTINNSQTTFSVTDSAKFRSYGFITIESEIMQVCSYSGVSITVCSRGASGTSATSHASGAAVRANVVAHYVNQAAAEIKAIETVIGATQSANRVFAGPTSGGAAAPAFRALVSNDLPTIVNANLGANAVDSAKLAVVNTLRSCTIRAGADNGTALVDADIGPQLDQCQIPYAATVVEIDVKADAGTPSAIISKRHCTASPCAVGANETVTALVSTALATASSGGTACSKTGATAGFDTFTTCSATLQNTSIAAGDWIEVTSATTSTAKKWTAVVHYTVN